MDDWLLTSSSIQHQTNMHIYYENYIFQQPSWHDSTNSKLEELHDAVLLIAYPSSSSLSKRHVAQATTLGVQSVKNNSWLLPKFAPFNSWLLPKFVPFNSWPLPKVAPINSWLLPKFAPFHSWHYQNSPLSTADFTKFAPFNSWPLSKVVPINSWLLPKFTLFDSWLYQNSPFSTADFYQNSPSFEQKTLNKFFFVCQDFGSISKGH